LNKKSSRSLSLLLRQQKVLTPTQMALLMALAIFACELGGMAFIISVLPPLPKTWEALIDSTLLITFLTPFYFLLYKPFWEEHKRFGVEIQLLSRDLLRQSEEERNRVSHELHDQCGQTLIDIQFKIGTLIASLSNQPNQLTNKVLEIEQKISQLGNELREVIYLLRPPMIDDVGLVSALQHMIAELSKQHPEVVFSEEYALDDMQEKLSKEIELALYRICQESLNNVVKYAKANKVSIRLRRSKQQIVIVVRDNGIGFDARTLTSDSSRHRGFGLLGMRERIAAVDGELEIFSESGKGTTVTAYLPA